MRQRLSGSLDRSLSTTSEDRSAAQILLRLELSSVATASSEAMEPALVLKLQINELRSAHWSGDKISGEGQDKKARVSWDSPVDRRRRVWQISST
jgi:hypothetical protein